MQPTAKTMSSTSQIVTVCLAAACVGLGFYTVSLQSDLAALRGELEAARTKRDHARKGEVAAVAGAGHVAQRETMPDEPAAGAGEPAADRSATPSKAEFPFGAFAQTFDTPEMRQMMRRETLTEARKNYADLLKKWNLPPADGDQFLGFVADRDSADANDALAMMSGGKLDAASIAEQEAKQEKTREENNARLKALLGDERYAEFEVADAREAEIKAVSSYRDQLESAGVPLTDDQRSALAKIVKKENPDENDWKPEDVEFFTQGMTDAQMAKLQQRQQAAHARISEQASSILSPDQMAALETAFRNELEEQQLALKIARTLFQKPAPAAAK